MLSFCLWAHQDVGSINIAITSPQLQLSSHSDLRASITFPLLLLLLLQYLAALLIVGTHLRTRAPFFVLPEAEKRALFLHAHMAVAAVAEGVLRFARFLIRCRLGFDYIRGIDDKAGFNGQHCSFVENFRFPFRILHTALLILTAVPVIILYYCAQKVATSSSFFLFLF